MDPFFGRPPIDIYLYLCQVDRSRKRSSPEQSPEVSGVDPHPQDRVCLDGIQWKGVEVDIEQITERLHRGGSWPRNGPTTGKQEIRDVYFARDFQEAALNALEVVFQGGKGCQPRAMVAGLQGAAESPARVAEDYTVGSVTTFERCHIWILFTEVKRTSDTSSMRRQCCPQIVPTRNQQASSR